ncbi:hypothetical protein FACS1894216_12900 [Synergistales bacterium]|nr:hypothetical protein FACS1894216_12900 [Synergistales bacterium]
MSTQTIERRELIEIINALSDDAAEKMAHYAAFLRYEEWAEEQEDAEDIAYVKSLTEEDRKNTVPQSEVIAAYEVKYGPLD